MYLGTDNSKWDYTDFEGGKVEIRLKVLQNLVFRDRNQVDFTQ